MPDARTPQEYHWRYSPHRPRRWPTAPQAASGLLCGALAVAAACGGTAPWHPPVARHPVHVAISQPCPATLGDHDGVSNTASDLGRQMVPPHPAAALVCRYQQSVGTGSRPPSYGVRYRSVHLGDGAATRLASAADRVSTAPPSGRAVSCPGALVGTATILVFGYPTSSVDLWYADTGCETLDNGVIGASEDANPTFLTFVDLVDRLAPGPSSATG